LGDLSLVLPEAGFEGRCDDNTSNSSNFGRRKMDVESGKDNVKHPITTSSGTLIKGKDNSNICRELSNSNYK